MKKNVESNIFFEVQKYYFVFKSRLIFFSNGHIRNVVSTLPNVVKIDVENDNVVSTLSNVVQFNVEKHNVVSTLFYVVNFNVDIHNVVSTLIWRCATSRRHINLKTTLNEVEMFVGDSRMYISKEVCYLTTSIPPIHFLWYIHCLFHHICCTYSLQQAVCGWFEEIWRVRVF